MSINGLEPIVYISVQSEINSIRCLWKEGGAITMYEIQNDCSVKEIMAVIKPEQINYRFTSVLFSIPAYLIVETVHRQKLASATLPTTRLPQMSVQVTCGSKSRFPGTWINSREAKLTPGFCLRFHVGQDCLRH